MRTSFRAAGYPLLDASSVHLTADPARGSMLSAFSVTADLSTCTRCGGVRTVSLEEFRSRVRGRPFRFLLRYHLRHHDRERVRRGLEGALAVLPPPARRLARTTAEAWREELREGELAGADCAGLLDRLRAEARETPATGAGNGDDRLFDLFEAATLSLVLELQEDEELREAVGGDPRPWTGRRGWTLAGAALLGGVALAVGGPVGRTAAWAAVGLAVLPPLARLVDGRW